MNDDYSEPLPSYAEVIEKSSYQPPNDRAMVYSVPQTERIGGVKYTVYDETMSNICEVRSTPVGEHPIHCICGNCHSTIITCVQHTSGLLVWVVFCILIVFGCWLGCCLIPFCIRSLQNSQHYCPNCRAFIGEYRPL